MNSALTSVTLQLEKLYNGGSGVMGNIWFEMDGCSFPEKNWNDFAETITGWWIDQLIEVFRSNGKWSEKSLLFMDGPCEAVLRNGLPVTIHFQHYGATQKSFTIDLLAFARTVITGRRQLLQQAVLAGGRKSVHADTELCDWLETLVN